MAGNRKIKSRIKSAGSISKITRAMEAVSARKMTVSRERSDALSDYAASLWKLSQDLKSSADKFSANPLLSSHNESAPPLVIIISSDRGLCGAFNTNLFHKLQKEIPTNAKVITLGKKITQFGEGTAWDIIASLTVLSDYPDYNDISPIARIAKDEFLRGTVSRVQLAFQKYVSTLVSVPTLDTILPIPDADQSVSPNVSSANAGYIFEPNASSLLHEILESSITMILFQAVLSSKAAEQSARMVAMESASKSAKNLQEALQKVYNKGYQRQVTAEIADVTRAAMSIKK